MILFGPAGLNKIHVLLKPLLNVPFHLLSKNFKLHMWRVLHF